VKKNSRGFQTKEPWYILTNFEDLETAIMAYQKRFDIEEMFRDFKFLCGSTSLSLAPATSNVPKKYRRANAN